jgi:hypothetical protein
MAMAISLQQLNDDRVMLTACLQILHSRNVSAVNHIISDDDSADDRLIREIEIVATADKVVSVFERLIEIETLRRHIFVATGYTRLAQIATDDIVQYRIGLKTVTDALARCIAK